MENPKSRKRIKILMGSLLIISLLFLTLTYSPLSNSKWQFDHLVVDNNVMNLDFRHTPEMHFNGLKITGNDGCNYFQGSHMASILGKFKFYFGGRTELGCIRVWTDTGEQINLIPNTDTFIEALQKAHSFEIDDDILTIYFGQNRADQIVFTKLH